MKGSCKWFNADKGWGWITSPDLPDTDLFVHYSSILKDGYRLLTEGERVEFDVVEGAKGKQAVNVRSLT